VAITEAWVIFDYFVAPDAIYSKRLEKVIVESPNLRTDDISIAFLPSARVRLSWARVDHAASMWSSGGGMVNAPVVMA
jgi:hypothetical protein